MGRIKTKLTKRITRDLVEKHGESFTGDFEKNKPLIAQYVDFPSKKIRNIVAGYVTRIIRKRQQTG